MKALAPAVGVPFAWSTTRVGDYAQLFRLRVAGMVLFTVFLGGWLAAVGPLPVNLLAHALVGTALVTAAASALNQWQESDSDARMARTANRPLPTGRLTSNEVLVLGIALAVTGLIYQWLTLPPVAVAVTAFTLISYVALYTPAKKRTTLNTLIGAVPGAMPPVIGWTAVRGQLDLEAVILFLILFIWQVPHFLAIAWMYRDQYAAAGYKMLTIDDESGASTARQMLLYFAALVPVTLMAATVFGAGRGYAIGAIVLAIYWLRSMIVFRRQPDVTTARHVLRASIVYLPALLALLVMTKQSMNF
jgi:protoheme IX farnesyltransferase